MGGHGGLNILPQKRWNVYNFDNREKVKRDEEAAAKEEHLKRQQSRKRDHELRLEQLRQARGLSTRSDPKPDDNKPVPEPVSKPEPVVSEKSDSKHMNLFEGIRIFDPIKEVERKSNRKDDGEDERGNKKKKVKREEVRVVGPEDEKYRLGYGVAGKDVKLPWYLETKISKKNDCDNTDTDNEDEYKYTKTKSSGGKKSLEELREERLNREKKEKERERALIMGMSRRDSRGGGGGGFSSRR